MSRRMHSLSLLLLAALAPSARAQQVGPLPDIPFGTSSIFLQTIASGMSAPDYAISPPGEPDRLYVLEQRGLIRVVESGVLLPTVVLDIQTRVAPPLNPANANDERGLLGLAFHPGFHTIASPGFRTLYTFHSELIPVGTQPTYIAPNAAVQNYKLVVAEWRMSDVDPSVVDPATRREVISFGKNAGNHNGGTLAFGPDGYLYLGLGDGGNANDVGPSHLEPGGNAQNLSTPLGKMLRFDPLSPALTPTSSDAISGNGQYRIPADNPFQGPGQVPEVYAYGLRNPYRFSFDTATGDLICADVGQNNIEEIDRIVRGGNYGWAVKEGDFLFNRANGTIGVRSPGDPVGLIDPIVGTLATLEYDHSDGISITGGFVYRGTAIPQLAGKYVFGDLALRNAPPRVDGRMFYADLTTGEILEFLLPQFPAGRLPNGLTVHGFGQDGHGELYALVTNTPSNGTGGILYKLAPDVVVPTLVEWFRAESDESGVQIEWQLSDAARVDAIALERGSADTGPWEPVSQPVEPAGRTMRVFDPDVPADGTPWYRLSGRFSGGRDFVIGPIEATGAGRIGRVDLAPLAPNPSDGRSLVSFALPARSTVRLSLVDVSGRELARLAEGERAAGRHVAALDARDLPAGLYFVTLRAGSESHLRRLVIVR